MFLHLAHSSILLIILLPSTSLRPIRLFNGASGVTVFFLVVVTIHLVLAASCRCALIVVAAPRILDLILTNLKEVAQILVSELLLKESSPFLIIASRGIHVGIGQVVVLAIAVADVDDVGIGVHVDLFAARSWELEMTG